MKKIEKWEHKDWFIAIVIVILVLIARKPFAMFIGWWGGIDLDETISAGDLLRSFILLLGVLGGAYGLYLSAKRQKTFSEQVQVQVNQGFNERLGRGAKLLADEKNVVMRCAGIRILEDLLHNATDVQKPIVANIIYDFVHDKATIMRLNDVKHFEERTGQDVQNAFNFLINLSLYERGECLPNQLLNGQLKLDYLDLTNLSFNIKKLKNIDFSSSHIGRVAFDWKVMIGNVDFVSAKIEGAVFFSAEIRKSNFAKAEIIDSHFANCTIEESTFTDTMNEETDLDNDVTKQIRCDSVKFVGGNFRKGIIKVSSTSGVPYFIGVDLSGTRFNFDDDFDDSIDINKYFKLCYYKKGQQSSPKMDASREYELVGGMKVFVLPEKDSEKKPWSGQPVEARIALEIAEWKLEQARETGIGIDARKKDVEAFANELKAAEAEFKRRQTQANNP